MGEHGVPGFVQKEKSPHRGGAGPLRFMSSHLRSTAARRGPDHRSTDDGRPINHPRRVTDHRRGAKWGSSPTRGLQYSMNARLTSWVPLMNSGGMTRVFAATSLSFSTRFSTR